MPWKYDGISHSAIHIETNAVFGIQWRERPGVEAGFDLLPPKLPAKNWSDAEITELKDKLRIEMRRIWEQRGRQTKLRTLINTKLGGVNSKAAATISRLTGNQVKSRTIQSWLIEPNMRSSRTCPEWAIAALEAYKPSGQDAEPYGLDEDSTSLFRDRSLVSVADQIEEAAAQRRMTLESASLRDLPRIIFEMIEKQNDLLHAAIEEIHNLKIAIGDSNSVEDQKRRLSDLSEKSATRRYEVIEMRQRIKSGSFE